MPSIHNNYVGIMAGGIGSRFWPESRTARPKQFLDLLGSGRSLLQWTYHRFKSICPVENIYIITAEGYLDLLREQLPEVAEANILCEPSRKNTAACAAYFAHKMAALNPKANLILSPADHLILDERAFERTVYDALDFVAHHDALVTLGIRPTRPDTGYGYIQYDTTEPEDGAEGVYRVRTFTEKPSLELAKTFLSSGDFLWNAGIFVWNVKSVMSAMERHLPEMHEMFGSGAEAYNTPAESAAVEHIYAQITNISIDYGLMEKAKNVFVVPARFGWSDLGTWDSAYVASEKDYLGNAVYGKDVMIIDATGCMVKAPDGKLVLLQGLKECIVVDTPDVLLICERSREQQIKEYVAEVKRAKGDKFL